MNLRRLKHVVALAEHGSFAQAADAVHLSQPAFSRSIQSLEEELQVELFTRGQRRITPTAYGKLVVERAQRMLLEAVNLQQDVQRMKSSEFGEIAIGLGPIPASVLLERMLTRVARQHASLRVRVEISHWRNLLALLEADKLDFFIADIRELLSSEQLAIDVMPEYPLGFYCRVGHPVLANVPLRPSDLLQYSVASYKLPDVSLAEFTQALEFEGDVRSLMAVQCDNMLMLERVALNSDLIVIGPQMAFREAIRERRLVEVRLTRSLKMMTHMGVVRMRDRMLAPGAELLISMAFDELVSEQEATAAVAAGAPQASA
jgi:DNA-binding transcriptional LysR family regulator